MNFFAPSPHRIREQHVAYLRGLYAKLLKAIVLESASPNHVTNKENDGSTPNLKASLELRQAESEDCNDRVTTIQFASSDEEAAALTRAWQHLEAVKANETQGGKDHDILDDDTLMMVKRMELRVVNIINRLGDFIIFGELQENTTFGSSNNIKNRRVVGSKQKKRTDVQEAIFGYFCDKNMLSLLVDIVKTKYPSKNQSPEGIVFHEVVCTPLIKTSILDILTLLLSNMGTSDPKSLYYLLSNNYLNDMISSLVPVHQFKEKAIQQILPSLITFLATLAQQLDASPHLFPFYCDDAGSSNILPSFSLWYAAVEIATCPQLVFGSSSQTKSMELILSICQNSNADIRRVLSEAFMEQNLLLSFLCQEGKIIYNRLCNFIENGECDQLEAELDRLDSLLKVVNDLSWCSVRSWNVRLCEMWIQTIIFNTLLPNLCISMYTRNTDENESVDSDSYFLGVDIDTEASSSQPQAASEEATLPRIRAKGSLLFLVELYKVMDYDPLLKMVAVSLLHPYSPLLKNLEEMSNAGRQYVYTPALNAIAQNDYMIIEGPNKDFLDERNAERNAVMEESSTHILGDTDSNSGGDVITCSLVDGLHNDDNDGHDSDISIVAWSNPYRCAFLSLLNRTHGYQLFSIAAILLQSIMESDAVDFELLKLLRIVVGYSERLDNGDGFSETSQGGSELGDPCRSSFESTLGSFFQTLETPNVCSQQLTNFAIDCAISLSLCYVNPLIQCMTEEGRNFHNFDERFCSSILIQRIIASKTKFAKDCERLMNVQGMMQMFPQLFEEEIKRSYEFISGEMGATQAKIHRRLKTSGSTIFLRNGLKFCVHNDYETLTINQTEEARFVVRMMLCFRAVHKILFELHHSLTKVAEPVGSIHHKGYESLQVGTFDEASREIICLGGFEERPKVGTDISIGDRKHFLFSPSLALSGGQPTPLAKISEVTHGRYLTDKDKRRQLADEILIRGSSRSPMALVAGEKDLYVLKLRPSFELSLMGPSGTILCRTPWHNILALATDNEWLHIAMKQVEDVGVLIRKGEQSKNTQILQNVFTMTSP